MVKRKFGSTGLELSALGFGGWGIGGTDWAVTSDEESLNSIKLAMDLGVNFFDSALVYGGGHSEELIGKAIKPQRDKYIVSTKIPPKNYTWGTTPGTPITDTFPKDWIIECTEKSLKNTGFDYFDIQQFHCWVNDYSNGDEWREAVDKLIKDGKIRFFGVSANYPYSSVDNAVPAMESGVIDSVQTVHNIYQQEPEIDMFPAAIAQKKGVIVRCPLDEGGLSGKITADTVFPEGTFLANYFKGDRKAEIAEKAKGLEWLIKEGFAESLPEAAIRYCLSFDAVSSVIVGMRNPKHAEANCKAAEKGALPKEVIDRLKAFAWPHDYWQ